MKTKLYFIAIYNRRYKLVKIFEVWVKSYKDAEKLARNYINSFGCDGCKYVIT